MHNTIFKMIENGTKHAIILYSWFLCGIFKIQIKIYTRNEKNNIYTYTYITIYMYTPNSDVPLAVIILTETILNTFV